MMHAQQMILHNQQKLHVTIWLVDMTIIWHTTESRAITIHTYTTILVTATQNIMILLTKVMQNKKIAWQLCISAGLLYDETLMLTYSYWVQNMALHGLAICIGNKHNSVIPQIEFNRCRYVLLWYCIYIAFMIIECKLLKKTNNFHTYV